jgi:ammonium transporter, Amt family
MQISIDDLWVVISAALVFFMQPGFQMVESGLTREKNSINVAIKNLTDIGISLLLYWIVGFVLDCWFCIDVWFL